MVYRLRDKCIRAGCRPMFSLLARLRISVPTTADTVFTEVINSRSSFVGESNKHPDNIQLLSRIFEE